MNRHLTPEQFVDAVEQAPAIPADRQAHLAVCQQCAEQLAEMQSLMADVTIAGDVPEPSPLFW
ncbi:MAG: ABC transporter substrate-binding protein, partial [Acidobacteria bacterium]|nr:ABC transporter substrate-binding protein [Acidobacteriota bacterium]